MTLYILGIQSVNGVSNYQKLMILVRKMAGHVIAMQALLIVLALYFANATDPNPLQDFCVATNDTNNDCKYINTPYYFCMASKNKKIYYSTFYLKPSNFFAF